MFGQERTVPKYIPLRFAKNSRPGSRLENYRLSARTFLAAMCSVKLLAFLEKSCLLDWRLSNDFWLEFISRLYPLETLNNCFYRDTELWIRALYNREGSFLLVSRYLDN